MVLEPLMLLFVSPASVLEKGDLQREGEERKVD